MCRDEINLLDPLAANFSLNILIVTYARSRHKVRFTIISSQRHISRKTREAKDFVTIVEQYMAHIRISRHSPFNPILQVEEREENLRSEEGR